MMHLNVKEQYKNGETDKLKELSKIKGNESKILRPSKPIRLKHEQNGKENRI